MESDSDDEFVDSLFSALKKESSSTLIRGKPTRALNSFTNKKEDVRCKNDVQHENEETGMKTLEELNESLIMLVECSAEVTLPEGLTISDIVDKSFELVNVTPHEKSDTSIQTQSSVVNDLSDDMLEDPDFIPNVSVSGSDSEDVDDPGTPPSALESKQIDLAEVPPDVLNNSNRENIENNSNASNALVGLNSNNNQLGPPVREKRKRSRKAQPETWEINITKQRRMFGQQYIGFKRTKNDDGKMIVSRGPEKEKRKMGPPCTSYVCNKSNKRHCEYISEDDRKTIFNEFWSMTWKEKQVFVRALVSVTCPKTRKGKDPKRRSGTFFYHLKHQGISRPVCKKFFLSTLGIKEWMALNWIGLKKNRDSLVMQDDSESRSIVTQDDDSTTEEGRHIMRKVRPTEKKLVLEEWLEQLPKLPAHYCRKDSNKLYLESIWDTKVALYKKYKQDCISQNKPWASKAMFFESFESMNLAIYTPRKDQCDLCCGYKNGNVTEDIWKAHINEKDLARKEKDDDKKLALDGVIHCITADVEAVKVTPFSLASAMYYKTKLCNHNYTVYNLSTHHCTCYWFSEVEGDLSANSFASCLLDYLEGHCLNPPLPIVIYTDGCTNQNRNQYLSNALLHFSKQHNIEVTQKFLIKGHTQMEGDSVHAMIERKLKNKEIYSPYELVKYTKEAREKPFPYDAKYLYNDFFKDFSRINYYDSIRPGRKAGDPVVTDIHVLRYCPEGKIMFKLKYDDAYQELPRRPRDVDPGIQPKALYKGRLPITEKKYKHLQELKSVIPKEYHNFYDNLPYK